jgi:hypothetical protein
VLFNEIIYAKSAFDHDFSKEYINWMISERLADIFEIENRPDTYLMLCFDEDALPVEILYTEFGAHCIKVFHCDYMKNPRKWGII